MRLYSRYIFTVLLFIFAISTISVIAQDRAQPIEGDGVYSFLRRHGREVPRDVRAFRELNQGRLNSRGELILGRTYILPPLPDGITVSGSSPTTESPSVASTQITRSRGADPAIFGSRFRDIPSRSSDLRGALFYIIAGHGGPDPGAITRVGGHTLHEIEYNYDIALRLARNLMMHGATVHIIIQTPNVGIRDERFLRNHRNQTCLGEPIPRGQMDRLRQRVNAVNRLYERDKANYNYIRAIEIHIDSRNPRTQIDLFMYHADDTKSRRTSQTLLREMEAQYRRHQPNRGFHGHIGYRNLFILRELKPPAIMIEVGNFQNALDRERILNHNNRQAVANWLTNGFIADFKNTP
jgi:N-acetylmuramoyl-L-alanine amidase